MPLPDAPSTKATWSERSSRERAVVLRRFADALVRRADEITRLVVEEAGCPIKSASMTSQVQVPLRQAHEIIEFFLTLPEFEENPLPLTDRVTPLGQVVQSLRRYTPIGVVAAIAAYNFPFLTALVEGDARAHRWQYRRCFGQAR